MLGNRPRIRRRAPNDSAMINHQLLSSTNRRTGPMILGFLGAVRLGTKESVVYTAGGRAP
jgi:hypothetical protein